MRSDWKCLAIWALLGEHIFPSHFALQPFVLDHFPTEAQTYSVVPDLNFAIVSVVNLSPVALRIEPRVLSKLGKHPTIALDLPNGLLYSASPRPYILFSTTLESIQTYDRNHQRLK